MSYATHTFIGDVTEESGEKLLYTMEHLMEKAPSDGIALFIATDGGDAGVSFCLYDRLRMLQHEWGVPIFTVACGFCMSAGTILLQAGQGRYATPHTVFMLHAPEQGQWQTGEVQQHELYGRVAAHNVTTQTMARLFANRTGMGLNHWHDIFASPDQLYFDAVIARQRHYLIDGTWYEGEQAPWVQNSQPSPTPETCENSSLTPTSH